MRKRISFVVFCLLLCFGSSGFAQELQTIIDHVQREYEKTNDIRAMFVQNSFNKSLNQTKESQGIVYFKKPGKMRWEYTTPEPQVLVSDGKTMWYYVPEDQQVIVQDAEQAYGSKTPITFLSGMGKLQNDFYMKLLPADGKSNDYKLELLPKQPQSDLAKLILTVDPALYQIVHTAIYDPYGNITDVYLKEMQTNSAPSDTLFQFVIPEGVDVIRQKS